MTGLWSDPAHGSTAHRASLKRGGTTAIYVGGSAGGPGFVLRDVLRGLCAIGENGHGLVEHFGYAAADRQPMVPAVASVT